MARHHRARWLRGRSYKLGPQLDTFLVCAATAVVVNRLVLIILGYPQIGSRKSDGVHISHSIYGGLMMLIAMIAVISFLAPSTRWFVAVLGGLGFGWYVDELGKYVSNAGYLFVPALALIYVVFVVLFLVVRSLASRTYGPDDALANALESLKSAGDGTLDDVQRRQALRRFDASGLDGGFAADVRELLSNAPASPPRSPGRWRRLQIKTRARYVAWSHERSFTIVIEVFFVLLALSTLGGAIGLSVDGPGITQPSEKVATYAAVAAGVLVVIGIWQLRRNRLTAFRWFDRALLIWILVVQVYMFRQMQFAAVLGLAVDLFVWAMVRSAITVEEQRQLLGDDTPEIAPSSSPPASSDPPTTEPLAT
jgi:hypothetical protein